MNAIYAFLNIVMPQMWDEGWSSPSQVVVLVLATVILALFVKWFLFGGLSDLLDGIIFHAVDPQPETDVEQNAQAGKGLAIGLMCLASGIIIYTIASTDWAAWYQERKYLIWIIAAFASFLTASTLGAWIDRKLNRKVTK